jgi:hypothetical protein
MKKLCIIENLTDSSTWENLEVASVSAYLHGRYGVMPSGARLYRGNISELTDCTPTCKKEIEELEACDEQIYFIIYPEGPVALMWISIAISVISIAVAFLIKPKIPNTAIRNTQNESPNNGLSNRTNQARPNARIPDIYGQVRSYPDLLALPFKFFENNVEFEHAYMGIGRGLFNIEEVRDGDTKLQDIPGVKCAIYQAGDSPNSGTPYYQTGDDINIPIKTCYRSNSVDGQTLRAPNSGYYVGKSDTWVQGPNRIVTLDIPLHEVDFGDYFSVGDTLRLSGTTFTLGASELDLSGDYIVSGVLSEPDYTVIELENPGLVNPNWVNLLPSLSTDWESPVLENISISWTGFFTLNEINVDEIWCNVVAPNGLFKDDGTNRFPFDVDFEVELQQIDSVGNPIGSPSTHQGTITGSQQGVLDRGKTLKITGLTPGRYKIRMRRTTESDLTFNGQIMDEVKWRDLYYFTEATGFNTNEISTTQVVTKATPQALAVKERKLNILLTRKLILSGSPQATTSAFHAMQAIMEDSRIGGMAQTYGSYDFGVATTDISDYFGTSRACEFSYTFDNSNISFEEMIATIAGVIHCQAYRQGSQIKLKFERSDANSILLFNHRNKIPDSETRIVNFGWNGENDGVEYTYVDSSDDSIQTLYFPENRSAIKPKKIESIGVRSKIQAYFLAKRIYNKIKYQSLTCEFDALQESNLLVIGDKILNSDSTRQDVQDGQVESQNGLELTLSQPVSVPTGGGTIHLQHVDGSVEALGVSQGSTPHKVILAQAPRLPLSLGVDAYAKATFLLVGNDDARVREFLLVEKSPKGNFSNSLKCINFDSRYYDGDDDFIDGIIDENGNLI